MCCRLKILKFFFRHCDLDLFWLHVKLLHWINTIEAVHIHPSVIETQHLILLSCLLHSLPQATVELLHHVIRNNKSSNSSKDQSMINGETTEVWTCDRCGAFSCFEDVVVMLDRPPPKIEGCIPPVIPGFAQQSCVRWPTVLIGLDELNGLEQVK